MRKTIQGVLTAIVTPFDPTGAVCVQRLRRQIQRQIKHDNGIFCNGTNGEFFVLSRGEKLLVTETCVNEVAGKVPMVAHIGEISTTATIKLGIDVAAMGVDAVSVITPFFVPLKQQELIYHYTKIADALPVPVFLYNIPGRTGNTIEPATARKLAEHPNIIGIKDSSGSLDILRALRTHVSDACRIVGNDQAFAPALQESLCDGVVSGVACVVPELVQAIDEYIVHHNKNPKPFIWTAQAKDILEKVIRANRRLSSKQNATLH